MDALKLQTNILEQKDISPDWFTAPDGLNLDPSSIESFVDTVRYDYKIYEDINDKQGLGNFNRRFDIDDLKKLDDKQLLDFGSIYGSGRVRITSKATRARMAELQDAMVFRNPLLERIALEVVGRLGGSSEFVGVHMRVGDGGFLVRRLMRLY